jgi:hypothetical protein
MIGHHFSISALLKAPSANLHGGSTHCYAPLDC